jgi:hypothetical protein
MLTSPAVFSSTHPAQEPLQPSWTFVDARPPNQRSVAKGTAHRGSEQPIQARGGTASNGQPEAPRTFRGKVARRWVGEKIRGPPYGLAVAAHLRDAGPSKVAAHSIAGRFPKPMRPRRVAWSGRDVEAFVRQLRKRDALQGSEAAELHHQIDAVTGCSSPIGGRSRPCLYFSARKSCRQASGSRQGLARAWDP